ncbi:MAG: T9SS type A sorting domain-containing protein [Bacteroidetes bacterium]|nr:T9SS type A sorting domain-containing protein [Bacteroidota bacterium]
MKKLSSIIAALVILITTAGGIQAQLHIVGHYTDGASYKVCVQNGYLFTTSGSSVKIYSITDTSLIASLNWNTAPISTIRTNTLVRGIDVKGNYLYIASEKDFVIVNIINPYSPVITGKWAYQPSYPSYGFFFDVKIQGNFAYLAAIGASYALIIVNISNPANPFETAHWGPGYYAESWSLDVSGSRAYICEGSNLHIVDISNTASPALIKTWTAPNTISSVAIKDTIAFVAEYHWGLWSLNVSNPNNPVVLDSIRGNADPNASVVKLNGNYAYLSTRYEGFRIIDITNPANLSTVCIASYTSGGYAVGYTEGIFPYQNFVFTAQMSMGIDIWRTTNIANPSHIGQIEYAGQIYCIKVVNNYMYIGSRNGGIWVVDISNPSSPHMINFIINMPGRYYSIAHQGNYLYLLGAWGGLNILDISNPASPVEVLQDWGTDGYGSYDAMYVEGNYAFYNSGGTPLYGALRIVNISNPASPVLISQMNNYTVYDIAKYGSDYLVVTQDSGLSIINIANKTNPFEVGRFPGNFNLASVEVKNNIAYVAGNINGINQTFAAINLTNVNNPVLLDTYGSGLKIKDISIAGDSAYCTGDRIRIFNISNPSNLTLVKDTLLPNVTYDGELHNEYWYTSIDQAGVYILSTSNIANSIKYESTNSIMIYPNPTKNKLTIDVPQKSTIEICNIQGRIILQQQIQQGKTDIDVSGLVKGIYILRQLSKNQTAVTRIIKE